MFRDAFIARAVPIVACVAGSLLGAVPLASAQKDAAGAETRGRARHERPSASGHDPCINAYTSAKEQQQAAHLREARESLLECAKPTCHKSLREWCALHYLQLAEDLPSVVPVVLDASGTPSVDVQVKVDGKPFAARLEGSALPVDPGLHEFSFEKDGSVFATQKVMIVQGQRNRQLSVTLRAPGRKSGGGGKLTLATETQRAPQKLAAPSQAAPTPKSEPGAKLGTAHATSKAGTGMAKSTP